MLLRVRAGFLCKNRTWALYQKSRPHQESALGLGFLQPLYCEAYPAQGRVATFFGKSEVLQEQPRQVLTVEEDGVGFVRAYLHVSLYLELAAFHSALLRPGRIIRFCEFTTILR